MIDPVNSSERLNCLCPGCGRTTKRPEHDTEWICANHWRSVSPVLRKRYTRAKIKAKRDARWADLRERIWARAKDEAIFRTFTDG